jgi:hypothetical protein
MKTYSQFIHCISEASDSSFWWGGGAGWYHPTHGMQKFTWSWSRNNSNVHTTQIFKDPEFFKLNSKILLNDYCDGDEKLFQEYKTGKKDEHIELVFDLLTDGGWIKKDKETGSKICTLAYNKKSSSSMVNVKKAVSLASLHIPADKDGDYTIQLNSSNRGISYSMIWLRGFENIEAYLKGRMTKDMSVERF